MKIKVNGTIPDKYRSTEGRIIIVNGTEATNGTGASEETQGPAPSAGLLGFGKLTKNANENTKQQVMFKNYNAGTVLKKFIKFTVKIIFGTSSRRRLDEKTVNATGTLEENENEVYTYNVTYEGTSGLNITSYESNGDYCFYSEGNEGQCDATTVVGSSDMNVDYELKQHFMERDGQSNFFVDNTDSFDLNVVLNDNDVLKDNSDITFNCLNSTNSKEINTECLLTNVNAKRYKITCKPTEVIYTTINKVNLIYSVTSRRNIRILDDATEKHLYTLRNSTNGNETLLFIPNNTNSTIPSDDTTKYKFKTNRTSKKGLNGGAITAMVLASVAALAGLVAAIYCLNRPKPNIVNNNTATSHVIYSSQNKMNI
jgi:hypothetical protein